MNIAFLSNGTVDFIAKEFKKMNPNDNFFIGGYNQAIYNLTNDSELKSFKPDYIYINLDGDELLKLGTLKEIKNHLSLLCTLSYKNFPESILIIDTIYLENRINSMENYNKKNGRKYIQNDINQFLLEQATIIENFYTLDTLSIIEEHGSQTILDNSMYVLGNVRYTKKGNVLIAKQLRYLINSILNKTFKCLVLDLDNTLWGGVVGEDGVNGIKLSTEKIGKIYYELQKAILKIKEKGILLALCSKNNMEDAKLVFDTHEYCPLKWDDFIIHKVNWNVKSKNIKEIALELNIGEDSLVFIDDNPMERDIAKSYTSVVVPDFPNKPEDLLNFIYQIDKEYFSKQKILTEDIEKTQQYEENLKRNQAQTSFVDYEDYLKSLNTVVKVYKNDITQIPRISQLTQKTNQFNFTTKRYTEVEIKNFLASEDFLVYTGKVSDKFGDYGLVILAIVNIKDNVFIDTFLMSCRVIGKKVENHFIDHIVNDVNRNISIEYIPTKKNVLVKDKLPELGFNVVNNEDNIYLYTV